jgi:hypothetical protein
MLAFHCWIQFQLEIVVCNVAIGQVSSKYCSFPESIILLKEAQQSMGGLHILS